ncbi:anaerobic ribonucleoside-triphosphate reductase activating protein [Niallia nealsonii]|uniref:Anaerobic ribonucleoside-triphosphate reductase-activating protein n=1 Tax=Niallia nealsonii TaxID=115979 RepID=A0A2N0Z7U6_9BACI|nr:anaerobic ribonucleoside-triphosphate reductase activating protein [Niallia nealsonii]PKG25577.1 anaerobic ribonucleoside-triphosphate reductase activating protein [Niallia nealsonii]
MKVITIIHDSIVDGPGLRSTVFFAGCPHHCFGCHNPKSWVENFGASRSVDDIYEELMMNTLTNITFSGGEPLLQLDELIILAKKLKQRRKNIWCYTGYKWENLVNLHGAKFLEFCSEIDILVDGPFILQKRDLALLFKGSSNQRLIDCQKSLLENKLVLYE